MLEISQVNYSNPRFTRAKKLAFKNNPNSMTQSYVQAALPIASAPATTSAKHIINLIPDSYLDEIGGIALAAGLTVASRGKSKKFSQKLSELAENNSKLQQTVGSMKDGAMRVIDEAKKAVNGYVNEKTFEQRLADTSNGLKREIVNDAQARIDAAKTVMGLETDGKIGARLAGFSKHTEFFSEAVEVNGARFNLATILEGSRLTGEPKVKLENLLRNEAIRRANPLSRLPQIPQKGDIAIVTSEFKGLASTGGMSAVPKDIADNLVKMFTRSEQDVTATVYMPLYRGRVEAERFRYLRRGENGMLEYVERAKNKKGVFEDNVITPLEKIHEYKSKVYTDSSALTENIDVYEGRQLVELPGEFEKRFADLPDDLKAKFNAMEIPKNEQDYIRHPEKYNIEHGKFVFSKDKYGKSHVGGVIKTVFLDNGAQGRFDLNVAEVEAGKTTNIYANTAIAAGETERFAYFDRFLYDLFKSETKPVDKLRDPSLILGNDWQCGGLVAMMRLLAPTQKAYGELHPEKADQLYNTPIITILHNATLSGGAWHSQEKMLNILFGDKASTIVPNAHMKFYLEGKTPNMSNKLWNGLLEGQGANNTVGVSPQIMAATYSDFVVPVSGNYTEEIANKFVFGRERQPLFSIFAHKGAYESKDIWKAIYKQAGIDVSDEAVLGQKKLIGITNGCDASKNTLTAGQIKKIEGWLGIESGKLQPYRPDMNALEWHNRNKLVGIEILKRDVPAAGNPMKIVQPEKVDLSDIDVNTPIYVSAGRITDQKGIDLWAKSIVEFYKKFDKNNTNPPVFYLQGTKQTADDQKLIDAFLAAKEEVAKINPKAAKRMLYAGLFSEEGRFDIAKIFSDFSVMPSWFEPCGLSHKEIAKFSGAVPIVNKTGGLMEELEEGITAFASEFNPDKGDFGSKLYKKAISENAVHFAEAMLQADKCYRETPQKYGEMVTALLNKNFDWAREGGPIYKYTGLMEQLGVLSHDTATIRLAA